MKLTKLAFINLYKYLYERPLLMCVSLAVILNFALEILSRRSLLTALSYLWGNPLAFICGTLIIAVTIAVGLFTKRRMFSIALISAVWVTLGVTNWVLLGYRNTPLSNVDFKIITTAFKMIGIYLSLYQIILLILLIFSAVACIILLWFKTPKRKIPFIKSVSAAAVLLIGTVLTTSIGVSAETISNDFTNLAEAYDDYGFVYCFSRTVFDSGIKTPYDYSDEKINGILSKIALENEQRNPDIIPNIIVVQLESFYDIGYIGYDCDIPNFRRLRDENPSGFFTVPSFGSGTANTEFEVLTGMSIDFFGPGEFPYYTIAKESACDSAAHTLKSYGYKTHAIHNNTGTFYQRNIAYPNLGFDTFTSLEYMYNPEYTETGWVKDKILTDSIIECLESDDDRDFVFAVSVQPHGKYPDENPFEYYAGQLNEVDDFIGELIESLSASNFDEPVMLVLYGDHLPALEIEPEQCNLYQTEYVLWTNYEISKPDDEDIYTYDLFAKIFDITGMNSGLIIESRREKLSESDILSLSYDILYGDNFAGIYRIPVDMRMGIHDISITGVYQIYDSVQIRGSNFNEYSVAFINGSDKETVYIDDKTLIIPDTDINSHDIVYIGQVSPNKFTLSESEQYIYINYNEEDQLYE